MIDRTTKLRWRRQLRKQKRQVEDIGVTAEENLEKLFIKRLARLVEVRRFAGTWLLLLVLLISGLVVQTRSLSGLYQVDAPVPGGTFTEGILGAFTNANPLYAAGAVDSAVSKLVFSGLMRYDENNQLAPDLAESLEVDEAGSTYTVKLRDDIYWHDGTPITAEDVLFTYRVIQNPDAKSPLRPSWVGISLEAVDERTVVFRLPNSLTSFPYSLTSGLVPRHILKDIEVSQLRSSNFNTARPVGSGPFRWDAIEVQGGTADEREEQIGLEPYDQFHRGEPKLQKYIIRTFRNEQRMVDSLLNQELHAVAGLESMPDTLAGRQVQEYSVPLTGQVAAFFKTTEPPLDDAKVRRALVRSVDQTEIIRNLGYPALASKSPLLQNHIGYNKNLVQLGYDPAAARKLLDEAGWAEAADGVRQKGDQSLRVNLFAPSTTEYAYVTRELQKYWGAVGVDVQVIMQSAADIQATVAHHEYGILLYGISLGTDPDVFPYWHSSQATARSGSWLNFSEYQSPEADTALEAGRTRSDEQLRAIKYEPFLKAWRADAPALALYQPRFLYVSRTPIANFEPSLFNSASDRYVNVENWMIRQGKALKP